MKRLLVAILGCIISSSALKADSGFLATHKKKVAFLAAVVGHVMLRKYNKGYQALTDKIYDKTKDTVLHKVVLPVVGKIEHIKDEGISRHDVIQSSVVTGLIVGIIAHYELYKGDLSRSIEILTEDGKVIRKHRLLVGFSSLALGALTLSYLEGLNMTHLQKFIYSLTHKQKKAIAECDHMTRLVDQAHDDPKALRSHDPLQDLLHDHQKDLLDKAVQDHLIHSDPLSLLDDLDDF